MLNNTVPKRTQVHNHCFQALSKLILCIFPLAVGLIGSWLDNGLSTYTKSRIKCFWGASRLCGLYASVPEQANMWVYLSLSLVIYIYQTSCKETFKQRNKQERNYFFWTLQLKTQLATFKKHLLTIIGFIPRLRSCDLAVQIEIILQVAFAVEALAEAKRDRNASLHLAGEAILDLQLLGLPLELISKQQILRVQTSCT